MKTDIYSFQNYRDYLDTYLSQLPAGGHGFRTQIAEAAGVQNAYVSKILGGQADFSLEQAIKLQTLLQHNEDEHHYFLLFIQEARAGTPELRRYFIAQRDIVTKKRLDLKNRLETTKVPMTDAQKAEYYSTWVYGVIHALSSLAKFSDYQSIASRLKLDTQLVIKIVDFLVQTGMLVEEQGQIRIGTVRMHLAQDSPYISQLHTQWRLKAIESLRTQRPEDLHYSSVVTVSYQDAIEIKNLLISQIDKVKGIIKESQDEDAFALNLDFFRV